MGKHPSESPEIHCLYRKCTAGKKIGKLWDSDCNHDDTMDPNPNKKFQTKTPPYVFAQLVGEIFDNQLRFKTVG